MTHTDAHYCRECDESFRASQLVAKSGRKLIPTHGDRRFDDVWRACPGGKRPPAPAAEPLTLHDDLNENEPAL